MIRLTNVSKYFNKKKSNEIRAIDNTTIELGDKGLVTFLGNSGCGKTTLLNAIGGLDNVDKGDIYIDDKKITHISSGKKDEIRNINIGYIFQNYNLIDDDTVFENVALVLAMMGIKDKSVVEKRVMYILEKVGIDKYRNRPAKMLSGGERQRVGIARALVKNPKIIIADEPTGNLDSKNTLEIMNIIKAISRDKLVILVTHEKEIAEFYSSRILEIIDGKIVNDRTNDHDDTLDYRIENKIYLKDLKVHEEASCDNVKLSYYSDNDEKPLNVRIVVKNNNIYLETDGNLQMGIENIEMVDDHYKAISKDVYEKYEFDYEKMIDENFVPKYSSIFNLKTLLIEGYRKVFNYSVIKKILMLGFIFASMFVIYAVSNTAGVLDVEDNEFVNINKNYLTVKTAKIKFSDYKKYETMDGVDYAIPGSSIITMTFPIDDYYQTAGASCNFSGSLSSIDMLKREDLIFGSMPTNNQEIVVDKMVISSLLENNTTQQIGIDSSKKFIGRTARVNVLDDFKIVGIVDLGSPSIYANKSMFMDLLINKIDADQEASYSEDGTADENGESAIVSYNLVKNKDEIKITSGSAPKTRYEVIVDESYKTEKSIGSTINTKVNGKKLKIVGFYKDKRNQNNLYVSGSTAKINYIVSQKNITLSPVDKLETFNELQAGGTNVIDNYVSDKEKHANESEEHVLATMLVSIVILIISLIEMYLMLRSSFLSRIKEVGVLRAIGLKKKDIYKMFMGEIIALTTITAIPAMAIMAYILNGICKIPGIGTEYMMNPAVVIGSFGIVLIFNLLAGFLPVFTTLRKTPASILARNDVN